MRLAVGARDDAIVVVLIVLKLGGGYLGKRKEPSISMMVLRWVGKRDYESSTADAKAELELLANHARRI